jgi:LPS export ABC transporter permease LptF/LPS export ABC transporter permease LptG
VFRLLSRYIFREILTSSLLGTLLAAFVVFLQQIDKLFEILVGSSPDPRTIAWLFALTVPPVLPLTIPFGVLVGILIGLGRMSSDGEITAMRAAGVPSRAVIAPVMLFAALGTVLAGVASLRLTPYSLRESTALINKLISGRLSAEIQPRIFEESFPNTILYVGDVIPGETVQWRSVFIADVTPADQRSSGIGARADGPMVTTARGAYATSDPVNNRLQLDMRDYATHEMGKDGTAHDETAPFKTLALYAKPPEQRRLASSAMNTGQLMRYRGPAWLEMSIELHRRFAFPLACMALALVGIPLGIATRKGGRSAGYVNAIFLSFFGYYLASVSLVGVAKQRSIPVPVALWLPDAVFALAGVFFLYRMEKPGDRDLLAIAQRGLASVFDRIKPESRGAEKPRFTGWRVPLLPQLVDTYILSSFLFYLAVVLASFVSMTEVWNFFELMGDMLRHSSLSTMFTYLNMLRHSSLSTMFTYLFFLIPQLIYKILPISVLVAVLVTLGVLGKQNEVTAFKACGVSLMRLAAPILIASTLFSAALFGFDYYYVPGANRRQDALRDVIKGKPKQTYLNPDRQWIMGKESRIYYYRYFDATEKVMVNVNVFELDPQTFRLRKQILAQRASWSAPLNAWVFENGWSSDFAGTKRVPPRNDFRATTFPELDETPDYFLKEAVLEKQMNFVDLDKYIGDLQQSGLVDTRKLQVRFHLKFANPLFALIMAMIAVPFGFMGGNRGAMTGIAVSLVFAIAYLGVQPLFEKIGDVGLLPAVMAAWSPNVVFALVGLYLLLRMRS